MASLFILAVPSVSHATDLFYPNQEGKSPNGRYVATATSPDNRRGPYVIPFQKNFTVILRDTNTASIVWSYRQKEKEASPVELIPTDEGYLIMQNAWDQYWVFDKAGKPKEVVAPLEALPKDEREKFTDWTTAGVMWQQYSKQGFFTDSGKTYVYLRTYWGRIPVIDFVEAKWTQDSSLKRKIEDHLVAQTKTWIKNFDKQFYFKCTECGGQHLKPEITENVFIIKKHQLREGYSLLKDVLLRAADGRNTDLKRYLDRL